PSISTMGPTAGAQCQGSLLSAILCPCGIEMPQWPCGLGGCRAARMVRWWPPHPYVISWALSCGFLRSSSASRQWRKLSSVTSGLGLTMILSLWLHTSKPIKATRRRRG
uniref:Uncharacterized protein n=1 Tax=Bubo bubo TaxID=30461 RepID=A0A8C0E9Q6_BUBBB